jgi:hypothetical protein
MIAVIDFLNPWALAFLGLVPILILLYFLKLKRPRIKIASTLLWQKVLEDVRVNSPFQRLKRSLLLLLQLLLLLALIFALARPWLKSREGREVSYIVVIDKSASMGAVEPDGKTRLEQAKALVRERIDSLHHKSDMMIVSFDRQAKIELGFTNNKKRLTKILNAIEPSQTITDVSQALRIAGSLAKTSENPAILLYSDGGFPDPGSVESICPIEYTPIGTTLSNVAVTQMNVRRSRRKPEEVELYVAVSNYSQETKDGEMRMMLNDKLLDSKYFKLDGGKSMSNVFRAKLEGGGIMRVEFDVDDALALDNKAVQIVPRPRKRKVLLVSPSPFYVRRALNAIKNVDLVSIPAAEYEKFSNEPFSTVIWSSVPKPSIHDANNIYLGCIPVVKGVEAVGTLKNPPIAGWDNTHPINRFIDYSNLTVAQALKVTLPEDATTLLDTTNSPLIALVKRKKHSMVIGTFDILKTSWPFQVTLLFFLQNCLNYFDEEHFAANSANIQVGSVLELPSQDSPPTILGPDGVEYDMIPTAGGGFAFKGINQCGVYEIKNLETEGNTRFAANLFNRRESELTPTTNPIAEAKKLRVTDASVRITKEYFRELILIAMILLGIEWLVYHRRILS